MKKTFTLSVAASLTVAAAAAIGGLSDKSISYPEHMPKVMQKDVAHVAVSGSRMRARQQSPRLSQERAASVKFIGNVVYSTYKNDEPVHPRGVYSIDTDGNFEFLGAAEMYSNAQAIAVGDKYYSLHQEYLYGSIQCMMSVYSMEDWSLISTEEVPIEFYPQANPSYDPTTGLAYGSYVDKYFSGYEFCSVDYTTMTRTVISSNQVHWAASFIDEGGQLYVIGQNGKVYKVDKTNGETTYLCDTGIVSDYAGSAAYDPVSGKGYWAAYLGYASYLVEIDLSAGECGIVCEFTSCDEIMGLTVPQSADPLAPAAPEGLTLQFEKGSLDGNVLFTLPTQTAGGEQLSGELPWTIEVDGEQVASGKGSAGSQVSNSLSFSAAGQKRVVVSCLNDAGKGQEASVSRYIGLDNPVAPANVKSEWDGSEFKISWDAVTKSVHDGYVDFDALCYDVYRTPGYVKVGDSLTTTSCKDSGVSPEALNMYAYQVVAKSGGVESKAGVSNNVVVGEKIYPPFAIDFSAEEAFDVMSVVDANNDGTSWLWDDVTGAARIKYGAIDMDDWLMSPAIHLEGGKMYRYKVGLHCVGEDFPEEFEIKMGDAPTAEAMTRQLLEPTVLASRPTVYYEMFIEVDEPGDYYIGVHGISEADLYYIYVNDFSISAPIGKAAPEGVSDLKIKAYGEGRKDVEISFTAPMADLEGEALGTLDKIEIKRDNVLVKTFEGVEPGAELSFVDEVPQADKAYTWTVIATNMNGSGKEVVKQVYVGIAIPGKCGNMSLTETDEPGVVTISWDAPELDTNNYPFDPEQATYSVRRYDGSQFVVIAEDLTDTSYTFRAIPEGGAQAFKMFSVKPKSAKGSGPDCYTPEVPVGPAYGLPWKESFAGQSLSSIFGVHHNSGMLSIMLTAAEPGNIKAKDNDGGFLVMESEKTGDASCMFTGKIDLKNAVSPQFVCYVYHNNANGISNRNEISFKVSTDCGRNFTDLRNIVIGEDCALENDWNRISVDLSEYKGQEIQVGWEGKIMTHAQIYMDAFSVEEKPDYDLELTKINAPASVRPGMKFDVNVTVANAGSKKAENYQVVLMHQGEEVATLEGKGLESMESHTFSFNRVLGVLDDENSVWKARLDWDMDTDSGNNGSSEVATALSYPSWPTVENLECRSDGNGNLLEWSAPEIDRSEPKPVTESFEDGEPFATEFGAWIFYDGDKAPIGGFQNINFPIAHLSSQSFWVHDTSYKSGSVFGSEAFAAHSGEKYLASLFRQDDKTVDDWAISPALSGESQTISVWAKSYDEQYKESFEILYSDGLTDSGAFTSLAKFENISSEWTEYKVELPAGAGRFAIRSVSTGAFMFMVDDVTYTPESHKDLRLLGYNVYKDGKLLAESPVASTSYSDAAGGEATYHVSVVYEQGESRAVSAQVSGVNDALAEAGVKIDGSHGITLQGAAGKHVMISTADGRTLYSGDGHEMMHFNVAPGIYMITIERCCVKVMTK